ncbi:MAG: low molecular weight protein arginine phosphatase [Pseudomonadota bacterium]
MTGKGGAGIGCAMPDAPPHVLFVCTGNTCRSPMAEGLFWGAAGEGIMVSSAGIAAYGGGAASPETLDILGERGLRLEGFGSRMVDEQIIAGATHVFCMTRGHLETLETLYPGERDKFYLVCDFAEIDGEVGRDVPDPIGGGRGAYEAVASCLDKAIEGILGFLRAEEERGGQ